MPPLDHTSPGLVSRLKLGGDGLTVAVKDCIDIAGTVSGCGSQAMADRAPAASHADVVEAVLGAGCRIIGKAQMHELAFGMTGVNAAFGTPINPVWPDRIPGGSSSGCAVAVAAGVCDFAIGTDTGGSVRQPATCCGVFGIKPTYGRISRKGCTPADSSLDCVGVFAGSAPMLTNAMAVIDPGFERVLGFEPRLLRITGDADPMINALVDAVAPDARPITLPHLEDAFAAGMTLISAETIAAFGALLDHPDVLGQDIHARLANARRLTDADMAEAERIRVQFTAEVDAALQDCDVLITPALSMVPPTLDQAKNPASVLTLTRFQRPFNLSGHPAVVLPATVGPDCLPAGVQIIGRKGDDAQLCAIAEHIAQTRADLISSSVPKGSRS